MPEDDILSAGEHGAGEAFDRLSLLKKSGRLAAAGAVAAPLVTAGQALAGTAADAADPIATTAVQQAKKYAGIKLTTIRETGPQAADDKLFGGPRWKALTGINVETIEGAMNDVFTKQVAEHVAKSGKIDVVEALGGWIPDFADRGVIVPIDSYIAKYKAQATIRDIHPAYRSLAKYKGKTYGFFDDGDAWMLYYRKDVFANGKLRAAYRAKYGKSLRVPRSWDEMTETSQFITDQLAPKIYGQGLGRALGNPGNYFYFMQTFRSFGGQFFDPRTMKALINGPAGVKAMNAIIKELKSSPPGSEKFDFLTMWTTWLQGKTAMLYTWPPTGRISENYAQRDKAFSFLPKSQIVGKVGYAVVPGKNGWFNAVVRCVSADSKNHGRGVPLHAVEHESVRLPAARHAPLLPPGSVPDLPLQVEEVRLALAGRAPVPQGPQRCREQRGRRAGHDRSSGLLHVAGQGDDRDVLGQGRPGHAGRRRKGVGRDHEADRIGDGPRLVRQLPEADGIDQAHHCRGEGPRRQSSSGCLPA